jgi:DNA-binding transcriptional regulator YhcF (GntR family)
MDLGIEIERSKVVWRQVADQVRRKILNKQLIPGTKLPSTAQMAAQIGTDVPTLHRALTELVCEGLLTRTPRIGTHVAQWEKGLLRLGIYHSRNILTDSNAISHRVLEAEVQKLASQMKISVQVWTDPRPPANQTTVLPVVEYAARERIIQGLISSVGDETHWKWFEKLPVPVSTLGVMPSVYINFDHDNFFNVALEALRGQGCRTVGNMAPPNQPERFFKAFNSACEKTGLMTMPEWQTAKEGCVMEARPYESFAFHEFRRLWRREVRPEGLVVYPDIFTNGVVMSILAEKVRVPEELKVVLHRNQEINFFCPFEATFVTSRFADAARAMIGQLDSVLKGREPRRTLLQHQVVQNPTA